MSAFCSDGLDSTSGIDQEDLCALNSLDLGLVLVAGLESQRCHRLQFVLVSHGVRALREEAGSTAR